MAFALALRLYGIGFGLPNLYYWDEPTVVQRAVRFGSGDLNPHFFYYPALYMYVLFVASGLHFLWGLALGDYQGVSAFATRFFVDPSGIYLTARGVTAAFGAACVLLTLLVGRRFFGGLAGLLGALFLSVAVVHTTYSHIAVTDVPQSLFIVAAHLPLYSVLTRGRWRDYLLCGPLIGLGVATKYLAILLAPSLLLAHLLAQRDEAGRGKGWIARLGDPRLWAGLAAVVGGFFIGSPFNFIEAAAFISDFRQQAAISSGSGQGNSFGEILLVYLPDSLGWPLYLAALVGVGLLLWRRRPADLLFLTFPAIYLLFVGRYTLAFPRYIIPLEPLLALAAGHALATAYEWLRSRAPARSAWPAAMLAALTVALLGVPLVTTLRWDMQMAHEADSRTLARAWAEAQLPADAVVAIQPLYNRTYLNVPLVTERSLATVESYIPQGGRFEEVRQQVRASLLAGRVFREVPFTYDYDALREAGVNYVFISDQNWPEVLKGQLGPAEPEVVFLADLQERARLVASFGPQTQLDGTALPVVPPEISVYEIR